MPKEANCKWLYVHPPPPPLLQGGLEKADITALVTRAAELATKAGQLAADRCNDHAFVITAALQVNRTPACLPACLPTCLPASQSGGCMHDKVGAGEAGRCARQAQAAPQAARQADGGVLPLHKLRRLVYFYFLHLPASLPPFALPADQQRACAVCGLFAGEAGPLRCAVLCCAVPCRASRTCARPRAARGTPCPTMLNWYPHI
mgnify:CR=1 FL=1